MAFKLVRDILSTENLHKNEYKWNNVCDQLWFFIILKQNP